MIFNNIRSEKQQEFARTFHPSPFIFSLGLLNRLKLGLRQGCWLFLVHHSTMLTLPGYLVVM
jgi:hypothetical protein